MCNTRIRTEAAEATVRTQRHSTKMETILLWLTKHERQA